ncbi:uncharacterized protein LOC112342014 isoform X1 [Selaginella moellendorffii]|uniref:uncharacterized protein LOC112342014 isoform X1 n=1 Tax=Selaginella moellendorffii TaxID=88036 RepID=UPI000D1CC300|nr:uncharacterized protein LOC112342014 isoform X1 [Selaginella moellendorffii]|eukprot:XP_024518880.1 uncharacterized protein LOC112342014 isoform X1 [Selaginella moellendorffii]
MGGIASSVCRFTTAGVERRWSCAMDWRRQIYPFLLHEFFFRVNLDCSRASSSILPAPLLYWPASSTASSPPPSDPGFHIAIQTPAARQESRAIEKQATRWGFSSRLSLGNSMGAMERYQAWAIEHHREERGGCYSRSAERGATKEQTSNLPERIERSEMGLTEKRKKLTVIRK